MEGGFVLDRWHVLTGTVDAPVVVPVHPFGRRKLDVVELASESFTVDELGLVESVDGFRERVKTYSLLSRDRKLGGGRYPPGVQFEWSPSTANIPSHRTRSGWEAGG